MIDEMIFEFNSRYITGNSLNFESTIHYSRERKMIIVGREVQAVKN
jgi:hypothetical protein